MVITQYHDTRTVQSNVLADATLSHRLLVANAGCSGIREARCVKLLCHFCVSIIYPDSVSLYRVSIFLLLSPACCVPMPGATRSFGKIPVENPDADSTHLQLLVPCDRRPRLFVDLVLPYKIRGGIFHKLVYSY